VPILDAKKNPDHLRLVEKWMRSYRPEELFDASGRLIPELKDLAPRGKQRMSANPHANGGLVRKPLDMPACTDYAVEIQAPGNAEVSPTFVLGHFLRDVMRRNMTKFRVFGPDELRPISWRRSTKPPRKHGLPKSNPRIRMAASSPQMAA